MEKTETKQKRTSRLRASIIAIFGLADPGLIDMKVLFYSIDNLNVKITEAIQKQSEAMIMQAESIHALATQMETHVSGERSGHKEILDLLKSVSDRVNYLNGARYGS